MDLNCTTISRGELTNNYVAIIEGTKPCSGIVQNEMPRTPMIEVETPATEVKEVKIANSDPV